VTMQDVSDATMLECLRKRYAEDKIYTAIGPVIVSVNPYKKVGGCSSEAIAALCKQGMDAPPHVTRVAYIAYKGLMDPSSETRPQSILISGESGAGKTEACKLCLLSLAELSKSSGNATEAALVASELLEAFGNAKTVYNNNSSRFGKWCAVYFDDAKKIAACQCEVYLLEKTRIINAPPGERNYHIFYQMQAGASDAERKEFKLGKSLDEYAYTKTGAHTVDNVDDKHEWNDSITKLNSLGVGGTAQKQMLKTVAANLQIGNLQFEKAGPESFKVKNKELIPVICGLLEIDAKMLETKLTSRLIKTKTEEYTVDLKENECVDTRDALAKQVYSELFEWIVAQLNEAQKGTLNKSDGAMAGRFIGLLDIFGFENFKQNSFEQLCINFTNEKLQAHFMDSLVKLRLEEYTREGIDCEKINFPDNQAQLTLLDHKSKGVFALLDDQCKAPGGNDQGFVDNCNNTFAPAKGGSPCFDMVKKGKGGNVGKKYGGTFPSFGKLDSLNFVVMHFAEAVQYTAIGWLDKNRGYLHPDVAYVLTQSDSALMRELFPMSILDVSKKATVGALFRKSLRSLSATMLTTAQNYVRCIKPNGKKVKDTFDGHFSLRQLRYTGVAAVVEIQRSGYPISMSHKEFIGRYRCITLGHPTLPKILSDKPAKEAATALVKEGPKIALKCGANIAQDTDWLKTADCQVGITRIYFRDEMVKALEAPRLDATRKAIALQRRQRTKMAKAVWGVLIMHKKTVAELQHALQESHDTDKASDILEALTKKWDAVTLPLKLADGMLGAAKDELPQLGNEIKDMEEGLEGEAEAVAELTAALASVAQEGPKAGYVKLKTAMQLAQQKSRGLREDLKASMALAEEAMVGCLTGSGMSPAAAKAMLEKMKQARDAYSAGHQTERQAKEDEAAMEAAMEAKRKADELAAEAARLATEANAEAAAEAKRLADIAAEEARVAQEIADMERAAAEAERNKIRLHKEGIQKKAKEIKDSAASAEPEFMLLTIIMENDLDVSSATEQKQQVGYSERSTGVIFSDKNTISKIRKGGLAQMQGMLQVGDTIIAVQGKELNGEPVGEECNKEKLEKYELTVGRSTKVQNLSQQVGEMQGWVYMIKAIDGTALALQWPKKQWAVLDKKGNISFFDKSRDEKPNRVQPIKGATVKTPVLKLRGQELKQPPVIDSFIKQMRFPLTLLWEQKEVDHDIVMATTASPERSDWVKALNKTLKAQRLLAPTSGWLVKQGGRTKEGIMSWFATNKRRWFVLVQPEENEDAVFRYYDGPPPSLTTPPRGAVILNNKAVIELDTASKMPNAFKVTSKGDNDPKAITTILAAENNKDMGRWMKQIATAIAASGGRSAEDDLKTLQAARKEEVGKLQKKGAQQNNVSQLAKLDVEQLKELPIKTLHEVAEYLDVPFDPKKDKDPKKLADLIMGQRNAQAADANTGGTMFGDDDDDPFGAGGGMVLNTYHSKGGM